MKVLSLLVLVFLSAWPCWGDWAVENFKGARHPTDPFYSEGLASLFWELLTMRSSVEPRKAIQRYESIDYRPWQDLLVEIKPALKELKPPERLEFYELLARFQVLQRSEKRRIETSQEILDTLVRWSQPSEKSERLIDLLAFSLARLNVHRGLLNVTIELATQAGDILRQSPRQAWRLQPLRTARMYLKTAITWSHQVAWLPYVTSLGKEATHENAIAVGAKGVFLGSLFFLLVDSETVTVLGDRVYTYSNVPLYATYASVALAALVLTRVLASLHFIYVHKVPATFSDIFFNSEALRRGRFVFSWKLRGAWAKLGRSLLEAGRFSELAKQNADVAEVYRSQNYEDFRQLSQQARDRSGWKAHPRIRGTEAFRQIFRQAELNVRTLRCEGALSRPVR